MKRRFHTLFFALFLGALLLPEYLIADTVAFHSLAPTHPFPPLGRRPMADGPALFVDSQQGKDANEGTEKSPWKTINYALAHLKAGDTLYLRGGIYHENVYCSVAGHENAPITIRSYPEERVVIDGGLPEFLDSPGTAWEPCHGGAPDEYRSTKTYKNIRDVLGLFGDSNVGLQTYWHDIDLRPTNENNIPDPDKKLMVLPIYCGPGIWYDRETGFIHARLAHTHLNVPTVLNYEGETDPRKLPLVISPFNSLPLLVDMAAHVRFQDLIIRGGGWVTVQLKFGIDLDFDNVVVHGGSYCLRAQSTGPLKMTNSALYGMIPPWGSYFENGLYTYTLKFYDPFLTGPETRNLRNIARLPTHYLMVSEGFDESSIFAYPVNHDWEVSYSEFSDSFDGIQIAGPNMRFHHNWVGNVLSNAIELSALTPMASDDSYYYQNLISSCTIAFSCHPMGGEGVGNRYVFRNILDNRKGVFFDNPSSKFPNGRMLSSVPFLAHGQSETSELPSVSFYQNTIINPKMLRAFAHALPSRTSAGSIRLVLNNLFVYLGQYPEIAGSPFLKSGNEVQLDGNLHWCPNPGIEAPANYLDLIRQSPASILNQKKYPSGWEANSLVTDPKFVKFDMNPAAGNDYHLQKESPGVGKGIDLPARLEDPLRPKEGVRPDIGAIPAGNEPFRVGIRGRIQPGVLPDYYGKDAKRTDNGH